MSYILDALRRADSERERGAIPGIHAQPVPLHWRRASSTRRMRPWVGAVIGLSVVVLGAFAWHLAGREATPDVAPSAPPTPSPLSAAPAPAPVAAAPRPVTPAPATAVQDPPARPRAAVASAPTPPARRAERPRVAATPSAEPAQRKTSPPAAEPPTVTEPPAARAPSKAEPAVAPTSQDTRVYAQNELPRRSAGNCRTWRSAARCIRTTRRVAC